MRLSRSLVGTSALIALWLPRAYALFGQADAASMLNDCLLSAYTGQHSPRC